MLVDPHRQGADSAQEVGIRVDRLVQHLDAEVLAQDFLPQDLELELGEAVAEAAVNAKAEGKMALP